MIVIDLPLIFTAIFFFIISFIYGWGLTHWFANRFRWSLASVVGIASVVSMTYIFVWQIRGIGQPLQAVLDLAIIFLAALPGMTKVDYDLKKNLTHINQIYTSKKQQLKDEISRLYVLLKAYESQFDQLQREADIMIKGEEKQKEIDK